MKFASLVVCLLAFLPFANVHSLAQENGNAELSNPSLGMGLNGISDWSSQQPFIDLMKSARPWTGNLPGQWGGWDHAKLEEEGYLDENGWLKSVPKELEAVVTLVLVDLPEDDRGSRGDYRLTYDGKGSIGVQSMGHMWTGPQGQIDFQATTGDSMVIVRITKSDPDGTGDYLRNISIVKTDNIAAFEAGEVFNPRWLDRIKDMRLVRFMDWMNTNNSTTSEWADRPRVSDYTYGWRGAPVEVMVQLANRIGADPWFTMPHLASDEYLSEFAKIARDSVRPDLKVHVEYSNEVWNWTFEQAQWAEQQAKQRWGEDSKWVQYYAMRAVNMARIWDAAFEGVSDQLVKVISTQTGWLGLESDILEAPLYVAEDPSNRPPAEVFDAYAITGYFGHSLGDGKLETVLDWMQDSRDAAGQQADADGLAGTERDAYIETHKFDEAIAKAADELRDGSVTGDPAGSLRELIDTYFAYHARIAQQYDLQLIMYEGGTHVVGLMDAVNNDELTAFFIALNYSAQMGDLYDQLLAGWKEAGGTVFNAFVDVAAPTKWGSWGALRYLGDDNPRWDALARFNRDNPGWWEERDPSAFLAETAKP